MLRHLVLDQGHQAARRRDRRRDPEQVEVRLVARVVHARDHLRHAVLLLRHLADDQVVLVVAGQARRRCPAAGRCRLARGRRSRSRRRAGSGARTRARDGSKRSRRCSISVTSCFRRLSSVRAKLAPTLPPPAMRMYSQRFGWLAAGRTSQARTESSEHVDRDRGRADDAQARAGGRTRRGPGRGCARRRSWSSKRCWATWPITRFVLSPFVATTTASASSMPASRRSVDVHAVTEHEAAGPMVAKPAERLFLLVDRRSHPTLRVELEGEVEPTRPQPMTSAFTCSA